MPPEVANLSVSLRDDGGRFRALIARLGCSLVLTADESRLLVFGAPGGRPSISVVGLPKVRGIAVDTDLIAVGTVDSMFVFKNTPGLAVSAPYAPRTYDAVYMPRAIYFTGRCDFHDMAFVEGNIMAVNTRYSCICTVDSRRSFTPVWKPPFISRLLPEDRCHLNGMAFDGKRLRYVTMLGRSDTPVGWRATYNPTGGLLMDAVSGAVLAGDLSLPHSPRLLGNQLYCLESGRGHLIQLDRKSGEKRFLARLPGFTHGLAEHRGVLFIGLSTLRYRRTETPLPLETDGVEPICGIAALDARTHEVLAIMQFATGLAEIYELQVLPNAARPDIRNVEQSRKHQAIEMPDLAFWSSDDL